MRIKCTRPILTNEGVSEIIYYFDTGTMELEFDEKDLPLLVKVIEGRAFDVPGMTEYIMVLDETKLLGNKENEELI